MNSRKKRANSYPKMFSSTLFVAPRMTKSKTGPRKSKWTFAGVCPKTISASWSLKSLDTPCNNMRSSAIRSNVLPTPLLIKNSMKCTQTSSSQFTSRSRKWRSFTGRNYLSMTRRWSRQRKTGLRHQMLAIPCHLRSRTALHLHYHRYHRAIVDCRQWQQRQAPRGRAISNVDSTSWKTKIRSQTLIMMEKTNMTTVTTTLIPTSSIWLN